MKKIGILSLLLLLSLFFLSFTSLTYVSSDSDDSNTAPGTENVPIDSGDVDKINEAVDQIPITGEGKIDEEKFEPFKSKAEERIEAINQWLKDNASWLSIIFGMTPELSWLFAINMYVLLFFLVSIVLNGDSLWLFLSEGKAKLFGLGLFIIGVVTKFFTNVLAIPAYHLWDFVWNKFLPYGMVIAVILMVIIGIVFVFLLIYAPHVLIAIKKWNEARKGKKKKSEADFDRKVLHTEVKAMENAQK